MPTKPLRIAWVGPGPAEDGGVGGVLTELLGGLAARGHLIDCFLPGKERPLPPRISGSENLAFIWGTSKWQWDRWYSSTKITAFASGLASRALAALRVRREVARRHAREPYDLVYQFSTIENIAVPRSVTRSAPLVVHPETHMAGELRCLLAERDLALRCQPWHVFAVAAGVMAARSLVQGARIKRARLLVCISEVFRDHLVHDYRFPREHTVVAPNPVRLERFSPAVKAVGDPPVVLVLGRVASRKGIDDVVALGRLLRERGSRVRLRVVGAGSLWSDYTKLLEGLPPENGEYVGALPAGEIPGELLRADILLQASKYEPFALTVAEALAGGVPVVGTTEVGALEGVDRRVSAALEPGDVQGMAAAIEELLERLGEDPAAVSSLARAEAERLYAPGVVCERISQALEALTPGRS